MDSTERRDGIGVEQSRDEGPNGQLEIYRVGHDNADQAWPVVLPHLERILEKDPSFRGTDLFDAIKDKEAWMLVAADDQVRAVLAAEIVVGRDNIKRANIWGYSSTVNLYDRIDEIIEIAKSYGVNTITFESPRKGWIKKAPELGFRLKGVVYEREI